MTDRTWMLLLGMSIESAFSERLFQESTTRWVKVCLRNKSRLLSFNSFRLWLHSPVELKVKNLENLVSIHDFEHLQHVSSIFSELKCS